MILNLFDCFKFLLLLPIFPITDSSNVKNQPNSLSIAVEQTRAMALIFSFIQCFPNNTNSLDQPSQKLLKIHQSFNPEAHLNEYTNPADVKILLNFVKDMKDSGTQLDRHFTNIPTDLFQLNLILAVLFHNSENWPLFYNTSVWLLHRVNTAQLFWALMIVSGEKFSQTVTVPSAVEIMPQLFVPKNHVLKAAGRTTKPVPEHPLNYWMSDPGYNDFHAHWHWDNPYWWDEAVYGVFKPRKGELFLYLHHQIICRFNAELQSIGIGEVEPLEFTPDYVIKEGFTPDIINVNYGDFFSREDGFRMGEYDDGVMLTVLQGYHDRLVRGIDRGFFKGSRNGTQIDLRGENGTDIVGNAIEASPAHSVNWVHYGSFHNYMHRILTGMLKPELFPVPGIEAHTETSLRDPVFYQIHETVDKLFLRYKSTLPAYSRDDLDFPGVSMLGVKILNRPRGNKNKRWKPPAEELRWPFAKQTFHSTTLKTFFRRSDAFDISNAARPCRGINEDAVPIDVKILDYVPFWYVIALQSTRRTVVDGMIRIFIWSEQNVEGILWEGDEAHERAIELDRFPVRIEPGKISVITRFSLHSSLTRKEAPQGIKQLYTVTNDSLFVTKPEIRRACGFPNNLLIPRGTEEGMPFKMMVYLSDETGKDLMEKDFFPQYPFCGTLNGKPFPDERPMGFPFDRPGTKFTMKTDSGFKPMMKNFKEFKVLIKHETN